MVNTPETLVRTRLVLEATTAADLMAANPLSISADATVSEAMAVMTERGIHAAPVINNSGRPVGVVSRGDILIHQREKMPLQAARSVAGDAAAMPLVRDIMTPALFSVTPSTSADKVVGQLLGLNVDHLFVVDGTEAIIGVISAHDVLRHLQPQT